MAYVHVAHDCHVGNETIFGPARDARRPRLGRRLRQRQRRTRRVHQFCRVGRHAFIGGYSVITKDALPYRADRRAAGRRRVFGLNTIGLMRRGFANDTIAKLKRAYRYLLQSKLNTTQALAQIEQRSVARLPGGRLPGRLHPHRVARRHPATRRQGDRRSTRRTTEADEARAHRRQRPLPVPRARRRARAWARRHRRRASRKRRPELEEAAARSAGARRCTGSRSASSASACDHLRRARAVRRR